MTEFEAKWIAAASYSDLLAKIRFEPIGSPWLVGDTGQVLLARFKELKAKTPHDEQVRASKRLGWK